VLAQALLSEKPVVTLDLDGAPEVVKTGETGILVEPPCGELRTVEPGAYARTSADPTCRPGDAGRLPGALAEPLAGALIELALDPVKRRRYGREGRRRCAEAFSAETLVRATDDLYRRLLARKGLPEPPPFET
jgi:glycosyltransferase involved in cell wall biosynthesis